jgi:sporulation protein YlmC with PRC-barrel domain
MPSAKSLLGAEVYARNAEKLGTIDDFIMDPNRDEVTYAIVDTGGWLQSRRFLVPAHVLRRAETDAGDFVLEDVTRSQVETFPPFDERSVGSEDDFADYERRYLAAWPKGATAADRVSQRFRQFEEGLRKRTAQGVHATAAWGLYDDRKKLEEAVKELKDSGFEREDISLLLPDKEASQKLSFEYNTKAPEGIATGATTGALLGGSLGWLASIGAIAIPGIGPLLAAGPIVAALAGAGAAGAIGGVAGGLIGLGMPELEAKRYQAELAKGGVLLAVQCSDARFAESARQILDRTGARDVLVTGQLKAA